MRLLVIIAIGCGPSHHLEPERPREAVRADGVRARAVELVPPYEGRSGHVVVELTNPTRRDVAIAIDRLAAVGLREPRRPGEQAWPGTEGGGGLGAPRIGGSAGAWGSSGGSGGSAIGGGGAAILGVVLLVPLAVPLMFDMLRSLKHLPPEQLAPGQSTRFDVDITEPREGVEQHLTLGTALDDGRGRLDVPVIDPAAPHGGWTPGYRMEHVLWRFGGGPIWGDHHYSGTGGITALVGGTLGRISVRLGGVAGVSYGGMVEVAAAFGDTFTIAPSVGIEAGWAMLGNVIYTTPTAGLELTLPVEHRYALGWKLAGSRLGIYGRAGPVWAGGQRLVRWEAGITIR